MLLGDPHGQNLFVAHPTIKQSDVRATEALSKTPGRFVLSMVDLFFSRSTLANSLVTQKEGKERLDADIMEGLRRKLGKNGAIMFNYFFTKFPTFSAHQL